MSSPYLDFFTTDRVIAAGVIISITIFGFAKLWNAKRSLRAKQEYTCQFHNQFVEYVNSRGEKPEIYDWLLRNSAKMQRLLGDIGFAIWGSIALGHRSFQVIMQGVSDVHKGLVGYEPDAEKKCQYIIETLKKFDGILAEEIEVNVQMMSNPLSWLRHGLREAVLLPISILSFVELLSPRQIENLMNSRGGKVLTTMISVASILGLIMTLILGWDPFLEKLNRWIS